MRITHVVATKSTASIYATSTVVLFDNYILDNNLNDYTPYDSINYN